MLQDPWGYQSLWVPSQMCSFSYSGSEVGRLKEATVRVEGGSGLHLGYMDVTNQSNSQQASFELNGPLSGTTTVPVTINIVEYEVVVKTADARGAGTDGTVRLDG
jgi:hypothetical protein